VVHASNYYIYQLQDKSLSSGTFFLDLLSAVEPRVVNWSLVTKGEKGASVMLLQFLNFRHILINPIFSLVVTRNYVHLIDECKVYNPNCLAFQDYLNIYPTYGTPSTQLFLHRSYLS
jgi:hypothetical protein